MDCVVWTSKLSEKIEVFQNHIMRFMTGYALIDRIRIKQLQIITGLKPIICIVKSKTLKLYGHIKRNSKGLSKICVEGMTPGKRSRGRPPQRWRDNIMKWSNITSWDDLNTSSKDRSLWKQI